MKVRCCNVGANRTSARQPASMDLVYRAGVIQRNDERVFLTGALEDEGLQEFEALSFVG